MPRAALLGIAANRAMALRERPALSSAWSFLRTDATSAKPNRGRDYPDGSPFVVPRAAGVYDQTRSVRDSWIGDHGRSDQPR